MHVGATFSQSPCTRFPRFVLLRFGNINYCCGTYPAAVSHRLHFFSTQKLSLKIEAVLARTFASEEMDAEERFIVKNVTNPRQNRHDLRHVRERSEAEDTQLLRCVFNHGQA